MVSVAVRVRVREVGGERVGTSSVPKDADLLESLGDLPKHRVLTCLG